MPGPLESSLRDLGQRVTAAATGPAFEQAGKALVRKWNARLDRGIGSRGRALERYAPSTAKRKGRYQPVTIKSDGPGPHLRDAVAFVRETKNRGAIRITDPARARYAHYVFRKRPDAFGPTVRETKEVAEAYFAAVAQTARRNDRRYTQKITVFG